MTVLECRDPGSWGPAIDEAVHALRRGELVVVPTDTGYGVAADAFDQRAVGAVATAKGRSGTTPVGVLVGDRRTLDGLCADVPAAARSLVEHLWPGPLTLVCLAQPSLAWDLGDTDGTVAVRMPDHPALLALLQRTGPLAVTGAQRPGEAPVVTAEEALAALDGVRWALDAGPVVVPDEGAVVGRARSTVVDATGERLRLLRAGAVSLDALRERADVDDRPEGAAT